MEVPRMELVVQRSSAQHADEVGREEHQGGIWQSARYLIAATKAYVMEPVARLLGRGSEDA